MEIMRLIIGTIIYCGLSIFLGKCIFIGLKTGAIHYRDTESICKRNKKPIKFWSLVILFSAFIAMLLFGWVIMINDVINKIL